MKHFAAIGLAMLTITAAEAKNSDKLCERLKAFEKAVSQNPNSGADWIDVHWNFDPDSIFSIACVRSGTKATQSFCEAVPGSVSMEFSGLFPQRILKCYSIKPNPYGPGMGSKREISFQTKMRNTMVMQTGYLPDEGGLPWMRLAIFPRGSKSSIEGLPSPRSYNGE